MIIFPVLHSFTEFLTASHNKIAQLTGFLLINILEHPNPMSFTEILCVVCMQIQHNQYDSRVGSYGWQQTSGRLERRSPFLWLKAGDDHPTFVENPCNGHIYIYIQPLHYGADDHSIMESMKVFNPSTCCNCWISSNNLRDVDHTSCAPQLVVNSWFGSAFWNSRGVPKNPNPSHGGNLRSPNHQFNISRTHLEKIKSPAGGIL